MPRVEKKISKMVPTLEIVTGLGMLGFATIEEALGSTPPEQLVGVDEGAWSETKSDLERALSGGKYKEVCRQAWKNGEIFRHSKDVLRGRLPNRIEWGVEWRAPQQQKGWEFLPPKFHLRVDRDFFIRCNYARKPLYNKSPSHLFKGLLERRERQSLNWFSYVADDEYRQFYEKVRRVVEQAKSESLPKRPEDLTKHHRKIIGEVCDNQWPPELKDSAKNFFTLVAKKTVEIWESCILSKRAKEKLTKEKLLWRMLRLSSCPYFVLGYHKNPIRLIVGTPCDWRKDFEIIEMNFSHERSVQANVNWSAQVLDRQKKCERCIKGHVEIRWSHGRFSTPEAKIYLDTPHNEVPGYYPLDTGLGTA